MGYSIIRANQCGVEEDIIGTEQYADIIIKYVDMDKETYNGECQNAKNAALEYEYCALSDKIEHLLKSVFRS